MTRFFERYKNDAIVLCIDAALFAILLVGTGSVFSGYHLVDDHDIIQILSKLENSTLWETLASTIYEDMNIRFRPLYKCFVVIQTYIFGLNMTCWTLVSLIEGVLTFFLLYKWMRLLSLNTAMATLAAILCIFGVQFTPWYRALNQENLGMLFIVAAFLLQANTYYKISGRKNKNRALAVAFLFMIMASLQKESFLVLWPAYMLLHFFYEININRTTTPTDVFRLHKIEFLCAAIVLLAELCIIIGYVGTNKIYVGISTSVPFSTYVEGILRSFGNMKVWLIFSFIWTVIFWKYFRRTDVRGGNIKSAWNAIGVNSWLIYTGVYIIVIELCLHAKFGLFERYFLPFIIGWWLLFFVLPLKFLPANSKICRVFVLCCIVLAVMNIGRSFGYADKWAKNGNMVNAGLHALDDAMTKYTGENKVCYIGTNDGEAALSVIVWEKRKHSDWTYVTLKPEEKGDGRFGAFLMWYGDYYYSDIDPRKRLEKSGIKCSDYEVQSVGGTVSKNKYKAQDSAWLLDGFVVGRRLEKNDHI